MKKILFLILFLAGISPVFKNNSLNLGCSKVYAQDMNGGELEEVFICSNRIEVSTSQQGDWLVEKTCHLENEDGVATNPCVSICEETDVKLNPSDPSDPCIDPITGENLCDSGDPDPNTEGGGGGGSGGSGSGGDGSSSQIWFLDYDGDGYHSETYEAETSPGDKWSSVTSGLDCDDTRPQYTRICCTQTCNSGYKLNIDTCECELLPPCWDTTVEGLMPDGSGDQSKLVEALGAMVNSFFKSSDLLNTMKTIGVLDPAELSKGFDNYIKGGTILSYISIGFVANDYNNNPTTENFMKIFVEGALLALPPPASVGYTALDTLYQKYFDGKPFSEILAQKMAEKSAELFDCDLGSGVYGIFH